MSSINELNADNIYFMNSLYIAIESLIGLKCDVLLSSIYIVFILTSFTGISFSLHSINILVSYSYLSPLVFKNVGINSLEYPLNPVCVSVTFRPINTLNTPLVILFPNLLLGGTSF